MASEHHQHLLHELHELTSIGLEVLLKGASTHCLFESTTAAHNAQAQQRAG